MSSAFLEKRIGELYATPRNDALPEGAREAVEELLSLLESGKVRAAWRNDAGAWNAIPWVKEGILLGFRVGEMVDMSVGIHSPGQLRFFDKDTYPVRALAVGDGVRVVPGGSSIRRGAYVARGVVCMPPMYINVGAYVDEGTMVDSHALVGSCAQIGKRVHLSAAAQIGGVLEPINAAPVVIEDDVIVGGNTGIYEGTVVRAGAVIAAGVVLTRGTPVFDLVKQEVVRGTATQPLEIPKGAVVVPGAREVKAEWGRELGISLQTPVIVKYRDDKTDSATALEDWLR
jgi:2,3,4,5-tetrahydropyridine-2-carboxylate N-succinyltransferase